jgi:CheY-like chemotaxis protein
VIVPMAYRAAKPAAIAPIPEGRTPLLVVEDSPEDLLLYERLLEGTRFQIVPAPSISAAESVLGALRPSAIILDLRLQGAEAWDFLTRLKREERTASIPVILASTIDDQQKGFALGAAAYGIKPIGRSWLLSKLEALVPDPRVVRVLTVDDEETYRFIVREMLNDPMYEVAEAGSGGDGLRLTHELPPDVILLDLRLTDMTGIQVCERLRQDPRTAKVPVILVTSQQLSSDESGSLAEVFAVLPKSTLTRDGLRSAIQEALWTNRTAGPEASR